MKIFHLSDLHIGLKLYNRDLYQDQRYVFDQIVEAAAREKPEVIVIAGDIYDKAIPSAEAVDTFDYLVTRLTQAVPETELMMISGNHDSADRLNVFRSVLRHQRIHMIGMPPRKSDEHIEKVTVRDEFGPVNFYLLPFVKPSWVREITGVDERGNNLSYDAALHALIDREEINTAERNVLVSHQFYLPVGKDAGEVDRMESEVRTVGNIDAVRADILERFDYAALGHIHKPMKVGSQVFRYCGTPLACSVSEAGQQKSIIRVELGEKGSVTTEELPLIPLRQVRVIEGSLTEVLSQACEDYVTVILTDAVDLDVMDMQDRLRFAFPNLLEIRRENLRTANYGMDYTPEEELDTFALCSAFLGDLDEEEQKLLGDVVNTVQEDER